MSRGDLIFNIQSLTEQVIHLREPIPKVCGYDLSILLLRVELPILHLKVESVLCLITLTESNF